MGVRLWSHLTGGKQGAEARGLGAIIIWTLKSRMTGKSEVENESEPGEERSGRAVPRLGAKENCCEEETGARRLFLNKHVALPLCQAVLEVYNVIRPS